MILSNSHNFGMTTVTLHHPIPRHLCKPETLDMTMGRNALSLGCGLHLGVGIADTPDVTKWKLQVNDEHVKI